MYYPTERRMVAQALPLANASLNRFSNIFPLDGTGWTRMILTFHAVVDWTNAVVVDRLGVYRWIKGILLRTSRGETIVDNVCGSAFHYQNARDHGIPPTHDLVIGADGTYEAVIVIDFARQELNRPEDLIFASGRYSNLQLDIMTGTVLDILNDAVGETIAVTMDIEIESTFSALAPDGKGLPFAHAYYKTYGPHIYSAQNFFDLESSLDLGLFGFAIKVGATTTMTCPFDGPGIDRLTQLTFRDSVRRWVDNALPRGLKQELIERVAFDPHNIYIATPAAAEQIIYPFIGWYEHSFITYGSINEHYATGKKALIRVEYTDGTTTDVASLLCWGFRTLR